MASSPSPSSSALVVFFRDKLGYTRTSLQIHAFAWAFILFLIAGPLVSWHIDHSLTLIGNRMAEAWTGPIIFTVAIFIWAGQLWVNYGKGHAQRFDLDPVLDADEARGGPQPWIGEFRSQYRRREYLQLVTHTVLSACFLTYYEIWVALSVMVRRGIHPMKGACSATPVTFRFLEKFYLQQFIKDLPFSTGDLINLYGKCSPDADVYAVKVMTSLANSLHWFLILFLVGFLWRKQIRTWFFPEKPGPAEA